ncbi:MAG: hypothetical protein PHT15_03985 [Gallionellaceae bacterium]|nr:hypothetical protein [Gallionellaceae bacterium]
MVDQRDLTKHSSRIYQADLLLAAGTRHINLDASLFDNIGAVTLFAFPEYVLTRTKHITSKLF